MHEIRKTQTKEIYSRLNRKAKSEVFLRKKKAFSSIEISKNVIEAA